MDLVNRMMGAYEDLKGVLPQPVLSASRMAQDEKIERLERVPLLSECTGRQLREVARITDVMEVPAGTVLTRAGDPGEEFFFIVDGSARVEIPGGKEVRLAPGEFFGEMSLLDGGPLSATIVAETPVRLLVIKHRNFATLLREVPALTLKILSTLTKRIRTLERARA